MDSLVKTFVVNLEDYKENFDEQKPYLEHVGIVPERFSAINALKNEHLHYKDFIAKYALYFTPKSTIGCGLSHVLLAHHINNIYIKSGKCNDKYFLTMHYTRLRRPEVCKCWRGDQTHNPAGCKNTHQEVSDQKLSHSNLEFYLISLSNFLSTLYSPFIVSRQVSSS